MNFELWYTIHDGGDGSNSVQFFPRQTDAEKDCEGDDPEYCGRDMRRILITVIDGVPHIVKSDSVILPLQPETGAK